MYHYLLLGLFYPVPPLLNGSVSIYLVIIWSTQYNRQFDQPATTESATGLIAPAFLRRTCSQFCSAAKAMSHTFMVKVNCALAAIRHPQTIQAYVRSFHANALAQIATEVHRQIGAVHLKYQIGLKPYSPADVREAGFRDRICMYFDWLNAHAILDNRIKGLPVLFHDTRTCM